MVIFGLLSYITPITPSGTLLRVRVIPLGLVYVSISSPIGSGREATLIVSLAIFSNRSGVNSNLSIKASDCPEFLAFSISKIFFSNI